MPSPVVKSAILKQLKNQWKNSVRTQYLTNPKAVKEADVKKNAKEIFDGIMAQPMARVAIKQGGIVLSDIEKILEEIQTEVLNGE